jgi:hypothetical protein
MTREEMTDLMQFIAAVCPQQRIDRLTTVAWYEVIGKLEFGDARAAVIAVLHSQAFIAPADIIRESGRAAKAHPSDRSVASALAAANRRELDAAPATPPTAGYLAAKDQMMAKMRERDEAAYLADRAAERKAAAWLDGAIRGRQATDWPLAAPAAPRWQQLPGDPPELRAWLARQPAEAPG